MNQQQPDPQRQRQRSRLLRHHLPVGVISIAITAALYLIRPSLDVLDKLSFSSAYTALALLAITLLIGPSNILLRRRNPVSSDLRRDLAIWAGLLSLFHAAIGQNVHLRGRPWLYYLYDQHAKGPHGLRHDLFGFNNFTGLAATLILLPLLATSNDWSLRRLGTPQWKQLQRWNYLCFALTAFHALGYQWMEKQKLPFVTVAILCVAITVTLQIAGCILRSRNRFRQPSSQPSGQPQH